MGTPRPHVVRKGPTMALANELAAPPAASPSARHGDAGIARKPGPRVPEPADAARLVLDPGVPHLKLDMEEPVLPPPLASSAAALALSDLDDPDTRALKALEQSIQLAKRDTQAQRDQAARLQAQLAAAESRSDWMPWLFGLLVVALAAIAALMWKLRQQNRIAHSDWFNQSQLGALPSAVPDSEPAPTPEPEPEPDPSSRSTCASARPRPRRWTITTTRCPTSCCTTKATRPPSRRRSRPAPRARWIASAWPRPSRRTRRRASCRWRSCSTSNSRPTSSSPWARKTPRSTC